MLRKLLIGALILSSVSVLAMEFPSRGTDYPSFRCNGEIVSKGESINEVIGKCGDPLDETQFDMSPHRVFVYRFGQNQFVYYFAFMNDRLERIFAVSCQDDDPYCD